LHLLLGSGGFSNDHWNTKLTSLIKLFVYDVTLLAVRRRL
jgi:hypothetical protein